ncbi:MAG: hypothetical protein A2Z14_04715 [Chloroflexi bacterium RBG_16_48_8]|nr:MAG: hypothetical protein A2Z14_04715 [Chloroflexi bacterium RBG_16_48_8]
MELMKLPNIRILLVLLLLGILGSYAIFYSTNWGPWALAIQRHTSMPPGISSKAMDLAILLLLVDWNMWVGIHLFTTSLSLFLDRLE